MARRTATTYRASRTVTTDTEDGSRTGTVTEEKPGMDFVGALAITTAFLLLAAIVLTDYYLGKRYGKGIFF